MNLLEETEISIKNNSYTPDDIIFIGSLDNTASCSWKQFSILADKEYDDEYLGDLDRVEESTLVSNNLKIVFKDGGLMLRYQGRYLGDFYSWEYIPPFKKIKETKSIDTLFGRCLILAKDSIAMSHR